MGRLKRILKSAAAHYGYEIRSRPACLLERPEAELTVELSHLISHCVEHCPDFTFAQIGAHDAIDGDPIRRFVNRYHWRGVLVEPQPPVFQRLLQTYRDEPQLLFKNVAIADVDGVRDFYTIIADGPGLPPGVDQLASFNLDVILKHKGGVPNIEDLIRVTPVPCLTPMSLFRQSGFERIDLLQIDTEGSDYAVLKQLDFASFKPMLINYEHAHLKPHDANACMQLLIGHGYRVFSGRFDTLAYLAAQPE